jgi:hypothetical protein
MLGCTSRADATRLKSGSCRFLENSVKAQDDGNWVPTESYRVLFLVSFHRHHSNFSVIILVFDRQHTSNSLQCDHEARLHKRPSITARSPADPPKNVRVGLTSKEISKKSKSSNPVQGELNGSPGRENLQP